MPTRLLSMCTSVCHVYLGVWLIQKVFMSQNYVGCCKQVYDSPSVCWLVYATVKECISCGKERNVWTASNMFQHICSKGHHSIWFNPKPDETYIDFLYLCTYKTHAADPMAPFWRGSEQFNSNGKVFQQPQQEPALSVQPGGDLLPAGGEQLHEKAPHWGNASLRFFGQDSNTRINCVF